MNTGWRLIALYALSISVGAFTGAMIGSYIVDKWVEKDPPYPEEEPSEELEEDTSETEYFENGSDNKGQMKTAKTYARTNKANRDYTVMYKEAKNKLSLEELAAEADKYREIPITKNLVRTTPENTKPRLMSFEEWINGGDGYCEKLTYTYYALDDTLVDENEEIVPNRNDILGPDAFNNFGKESDDPDTVYIHNRSVGTDYEIVRETKSYQEVVLGIPMEPVAPPQKRKQPKIVKVSRLGDNEEEDD